MSRYGVSFYGQDVYGATQLVNFSAAPFIATPRDHRSVLLTWTTIAGNWTELKLVRNSYGFSVDETDGTVVLDIANGPQNYYLDTNLAPGQLYYYTIWVYGVGAYNGHDDWRRAGDVVAMSVKDFGYTNKMASYLPTVFTTDLANIETVGSDTDTQIYKFLSIPGFQLDYTRSQLETLQNVNDPSKVSGGLLPLMANQFGLAYEPEVGMPQLRVLLRNIVRIYKNKGTSTGIDELCTAFTGWSTAVNQGKNLFLDYNDSSFEEGIGTWSGDSSCTVTRYAADGTVPAYTISGNKTAGLLKITAAAAGTLNFALGGAPTVHGIPIQATAQYTFSAYARAATTGRAVTLILNWYDRTGTFISASTGSPTTDATGAWTARPTVTASAPTNAVYVMPQVNIASAAGAGEIHYLDALQLEAGATATSFQEARQLQLVLTADRINEVTNPNFESGTTGWTVKGTTTFAQSTAQAKYSTHSLAVTTDASGSGVYTTTAPVAGFTTFTVSAWVYGPAGNYQISHEQAAPVAGSNVVAGPATAVAANSWRRISGTFTVPSSETSSRWIFSGPASSTFYLDGVLVERGGVLNDYFDGSISVTHPANYLWEGTTNASRSHYYGNRSAKQYRLGLLLADYVWAGTTYSLLLGQPGT